MHRNALHLSPASVVSDIGMCVCACVCVCVCVQDMYVLGSLIYLVLFAIENSAMMSMHSRKMDAGLLSDYDTLFCMMLGAVFIFCHLVFIIHVQITVR